MLVPEFALPPAGEGESVSVLGKLAGLADEQFEPVGRWFESYCTRRQCKHTVSQTSLVSSSSEEENDDVNNDDEEAELQLLRSLDPKNWKKQDHYAVLGIEHLRCKATDDQIKKAYKKKVLRHHPDKRRARGIPVKDGEEDYFTCITRAYETLGTLQKRRAYDSVDPLFDDEIPSASAIESKRNFYHVFGPAFERNARWSVKRNVPQLGNENTSFDDVNRFYTFWYEFESWREYSYLDEEEKEKGENRDERRWIEKQNKAARQKLKKEEVARIRQLVDNAYACDPRIIQFRTEEKEKKLAEKKAKQDAIKQKTDEEERKRNLELEEERLKKEKEDEELKAQAAIAKKEKEERKKILQKERKKFRTAMKDLDYMSTKEAERVQVMLDVDRLSESLSVTSLQALNEVMTSGDVEKSHETFKQHVREMNEECEREKQRLLETTMRTSKSGASVGDTSKGKDNWSDAEIQTLIKAVNLFPAGTNTRWEVINNFLHLHVPESKRSAKEVLAKAKELQRNDMSLKEDANKKAFEKFKSTQGGAAPASAESEASVSYESTAETLMYEVGSNPAPWTADEQKLLEQAMRVYPATLPDRWDRIAEAVPMRTKKDCMKRYKELVELIRVKKLAQATAATKKK